MDLKGGLNLGAMLRSLQPVLKTDALGLLEEAIPQSSSQRTYPVVKPGSQDRTLRKLTQDVIGPLKSGLQSFNKVSEILLSVREDVIFGDSQTFRHIRSEIEYMTEQMQRSESIAGGELATLDSQTELLTEKQGCLARQRQEEELQMHNLWTQLHSYRSTVENLRGAGRAHSSYHSKRSDYDNKIFDVKRKIGQTDDKIYSVDSDLRALAGKREAVADLQAKVREAVHHLGLLRGVGSAAELHTRRRVLLGPVMKVMEEMTTALGRITGEQLLNTEGIRSLMGSLQRNQHQLQQLVDARPRANVDYY